LLAWTGPGTHRHDFSVSGLALEVKSTTVRLGRRVDIHGHLQLQEPVDGKLYMAFLKLEVAEVAGTSVPSLIDNLVTKGLNRSELFKKLALIGYDVLHESAYKNVRFSILEDRMYLVDESFPRIVEQSFKTGTLPARVREITYSIDISNEPPLPISPDQSVSVYKTLATAA
jgi:hypothetical protein